MYCLEAPLCYHLISSKETRFFHFSPLSDDHTGELRHGQGGSVGGRTGASCSASNAATAAGFETERRDFSQPRGRVCISFIRSVNPQHECLPDDHSMRLISN